MFFALTILIYVVIFCIISVLPPKIGKWISYLTSLALFVLIIRLFFADSDASILWLILQGFAYGVMLVFILAIASVCNDKS